MRTDHPFRKSFVCGGVLFVFLIAMVAVTDSKGLGSATVVFLGICLLVAVVIGIWAFFSSKAWSWSRFVLTTVGVFLAYIAAFFAIMIAVALFTQNQSIF
jgi:hypothetical protein